MKRIIVFLMLFVALPVQADFYDGNALYAGLADYRTEPMRDIVTASAATGFVLGVADTLRGFGDSRTGLQFCLPSEATRGQVIDLVLAYLRDHPELRHYTAWSLTAAALSLAFPCKP